MKMSFLIAVLSTFVLACSSETIQEEETEVVESDPELVVSEPEEVEVELSKKIATVGEYEIFAIQLRETALNVATMFVGADPQAVNDAEKELPEGWIKNGNIALRNQAFVVKGPDILMMVGTSVGDGNRAKEPPFIQNLAKIDVSTTDVNYVFSTHFHGDHIGWHTRRLEMYLMPTFPNAKYLMITKEYEHWKKEPRAEKIVEVYKFGLVDFIEDGHQVNSDIRIETWAGHTPGHSVVHITSKGQEAIFTGDLMHHPMQCSRVEWDLKFSVDNEASIQARKDFFQRYADSGVLIIPAHFTSTVAGHITSEGGAWKWEFISEQM